MKPRIRTLTDIAMIYGYAGIPVLIIFEIFSGGRLGEVIQVLPLSLRIFLLVFAGLPMLVIPFTMWIYAMGKSAEMNDRKESNRLYYWSQLIGDKIGLLYYWRYIRSGKDLHFFGPFERFVKLEPDGYATRD